MMETIPVLGDAFIYGVSVTDARENQTMEVVRLSSAFAGMAALLLAIALAGVLFVLFRLDAARRRTTAATRQLAELASGLSAGATIDWSSTGVPDVDEVARTLEEFDQRLRRKSDLLARLNEEIIRNGKGVASNGFPNQLRALIDALPVGVIIAEAPSGRIIEANKALEDIRRGPMIYSEGVEKYHHWIAVHENGEPVLKSEYPLARALAGEARPVLECRHQRGDGTWGWISIVGSPLYNNAGAVIAAIVAVTDIDELKNAEEHRRIMNLELHHRVNNSLAMIQGIANVTARTAMDFAGFQSGFSDRIQCLSRLSTLLVEKSWSLTPIRAVATTALACDSLALRDRIVMSGEVIMLRSEVALALGMALHELLANAESHGALSAEAGRVSVEWRIIDTEGRRVEISWREQGGPPVAPPQRSGIGQYLMKNVLARQFGGDIDIRFEEDGVRATLTAEV